MGKRLKIYNLSFFEADYFQSFSIEGYTFSPIKEKQPKRSCVFRSEDALKLNRKMVVNAYVTIPSRQMDSVFRKDVKYSRFRKIKFLEDLLVIISICLGKNVVPKFHENRNEFPLIPAKHCECIVDNSEELKNALEIAIPNVFDKTWQKKHYNGFQIRMYYNATNIFNAEQRFLADVTIWEFLYYCDHHEIDYKTLINTKLNIKIETLVGEYLLDRKRKIPKGQFRIFSDLRNQLSHSGKLPIKNPTSPFERLGWNGCISYMRLFQHLTQSIVLKTIGIEAINKMAGFAIKPHLDEILQKSFVELYEKLDK